jgi:hypothetical protein
VPSLAGCAVKEGIFHCDITLEYCLSEVGKWDEAYSIPVNGVE